LELLSFALLANGYGLWTLFGLLVGAAIAVDLGLIGKVRSLMAAAARSRQPSGQAAADASPAAGEKGDNRHHHHGMSFRTAIAWTVVWISLALAFGAIIYAGMGYGKFLEYATGYALEKTLSVDNMFVFLLIFSSLAVPHAYQHKVLAVGVLSAIAMRIPLILAGVSLLETFHWFIYVFGALLLLTAARMLLHKKEDRIDIEKNVAVCMLRKVLPITRELDGARFFMRKSGILYATPLLVALVMIEVTDLIFAIDSIPAVLAITADPFIVITSNIFAILGLRSLYFALAGMMAKFYYLKAGLIALLLFIGAKMIASDLYKLPVEVSMAVIAGVLAVTIALSVAKAHRQATAARVA
jgi:tellurite resistance protein TerC